MPVRDYVDSFSVLLLDMNSTFMFGEDRFGLEQDYAGTYRCLGGVLDETLVRNIVEACYAYLDERYTEPAYFDRFPSVRQALDALPEVEGVSDAERTRLVQAFAHHEIGHVPSEYAAVLTHLADSHRLGLVADIWSEKSLWLAELERAGVLHLFEALIFSSDLGSVKPSPIPFQHAMARLQARPDECLMIGDSARRDVGGAKAAGLAVLWIGSGETPPEADGRIDSLLDLVT